MILARPEYLLQPGKLMRRILGPRSIPRESARVTLPWGHGITVHRGDVISEIIWQTGVYDLAPSEVTWRLLEPGETALDIGANIGYVSSLISARGCRVNSFEPHPSLFRELAKNAAEWPGVAPLNLGLSEAAGMAFLEVPDDFEANRGTAKIGATGIQIQTATLDDYPATFAKVDVEGFEASVFRGGAQSLGSHRLRDIVYEDFGPHPTAAAGVLLKHGYTLYRIEKSLLGPVLAPPDAAPRDFYSAPNYLATSDPGRAIKLMRPRGWRILSFSVVRL